MRVGLVAPHLSHSGEARMKSLFNRSMAAAVAAALSIGVAQRAAAQAPGMPASPLAGGMAAASGQSFMDAHGQPIVMPASYGQACAPYGAYGAACPEDCYGDAYADFGGSPFPDQCGPHYFDIAVQGVALTAEDMFEGIPPLISIGQAAGGGPLILTPEEVFDDYEAGWQIAARLDLGPLSVLEATYMGLYDIGSTERVVSTEVSPGGADFNLFTVFSGYGLDPIDGLDDASIITVDYQSDLQSTELSYRRYWVGYNPRVSGTYLAGFRYIRMTEEFNFNSIALLGDSNLLWDADNDLVGAQFGGDAWVCLRQGLRLGFEGKAGIYNNRFKFRHETNIPDPDITNLDFSTDGNQVAFAGESTVDLVADILPSFSIRGGYRVLYLNSLVTVGNNIDVVNFIPEELNDQADALYHGFHAGLEYIW